MRPPVADSDEGINTPPAVGGGEGCSLSSWEKKNLVKRKIKYDLKYKALS